jgi:hypothetical protein
MTVSGLVVKLAKTDAGVAAVAALRARAELTLGEGRAGWLPVALEARDPAHSHAVHDWVQSLPGVEFVDVVSVNFEEPDPLGPGVPADPSPCIQRSCQT